jgi:ABC-type phosphate transport system ATPase subunit
VQADRNQFFRFERDRGEALVDGKCTKLIVTDNLQQVRRCVDKVALLYLVEMIEAGATGLICDRPLQKHT